MNHPVRPCSEKFFRSALRTISPAAGTEARPTNPFMIYGWARAPWMTARYAPERDASPWPLNPEHDNTKYPKMVRAATDKGLRTAVKGRALPAINVCAPQV
jgi:hypothetical protein